MSGLLKSFFRKKPRFVIIGEEHPLGVEEEFVRTGKLKIKTKEKECKQWYVADIRAGGEETKKSIQKINKIIKEEADILMEEKINRLFLEEPATEELKKILSEFRDRCLKKFDSELDEKCERARKFKKLKSALLEQLKIKINVVGEAAEEYALAFKPSRFLEDIIKEYIRTYKKQPRHMFAMSLYDVAYKANVFDIIPAEDPELVIQSESRMIVFDMCDVLLTTRPEEVSATDKMVLELTRIWNRAGKDFLSLYSDREKIMCKNIINNYTPNSALICGSSHFKPIKEMLSEYFEVKPYEVTLES